MDNTWKNCEQCTKAHTHERLCISDEDPAFHCVICSKCSISEADFDCPGTLRAVSELNSGFSFCDIVNKSVRKLSGSFNWICSSCLTEQKKQIPVDGESGIDALTKLVNDLTQIVQCKFETLDNKFQTVSSEFHSMMDLMKTCVNKDFSPLADNVMPHSPLRKRKTPMGPCGEQVKHAIIDPVITDPISYNAKIALKSSGSVTDVSILKDFCKYKADRPLEVPDFKTKMSKKGDINLLFKSYKDALKTKKLIDEKMENMNVMTPMRQNLKRVDLVGLPFSITKQEAIDAIVRDNPNLGLTKCSDDECSASVESNSNLYLSILDIRKCHKSSVFRIMLQASQDFVNFLGDWNINCMNIVLHKYVIPVSHQCFNCQRYGHFSSRCIHERVCGKCASTSHDTRNCDSSQLNCINCVRNGSDNVAHAAFFHGCPLFNAIE